jgi:hypothetical protein
MVLKKKAIAVSMCFGLMASAFATDSLPDWTPSSGVRFDTSGWVSLTRSDELRSTANVQSNRTFSAADTIKVEFDYISWGGVDVGADGLAIYLFDAGVPSAGTGGYYYSALGYCRMAGAYMGIGLDEYGNFSHSCEGPVDGAMVRNSATIRGPQASNYPFVKNFPIGESLDCEGARCKTREEAMAPAGGGVKRVVATLTPKKSSPGYSIKLTINGQSIIDGADYPYVAPGTMKLGISASNGSYSNNHEIRNVKISTGVRQCKRT